MVCLQLLGCSLLQPIQTLTLHLRRTGTDAAPCLDVRVKARGFGERSAQALCSRHVGPNHGLGRLVHHRLKPTNDSFLQVSFLNKI